MMTSFLDLSTSMIFNDLEPPKEGFWWIFSQFLAAAHISTVNCDEMVEHTPRQCEHEIFSIERGFQQFQFRPPIVQLYIKKTASNSFNVV